jgi:hypothetical protein
MLSLPGDVASALIGETAGLCDVLLLAPFDDVEFESGVATSCLIGLDVS